MNIAVTIQARLDQLDYLEMIDKKPLLEYQIQRIKNLSWLIKLAIATTKKQDIKLVNLSNKG